MMVLLIRCLTALASRRFASLVSVLMLLVSTLISVAVFAQSPPLKASISKSLSVENAKDAVFKGVETLLDVSRFPKQDPQFVENQSYMKRHQLTLSDRLLIPTGGGSYRVVSSMEELIPGYNAKGELITLDKLDAASFPSSPAKAYRYWAASGYDFVGLQPGQLVRLTIQLNENEAYVFNADGSMSTHWLNQNCYRADGVPCRKHSFTLLD